MEIVKSRYGLDRSVEKIDHQTIRVMGESLFGRISPNDNDGFNMYDFEGGPCYFVGNKIKYEGLDWEITEIKKLDLVSENLSGCILKVKPIY